MATITENLQALQDVKNDMKDVMENHFNIDLTDKKFTDYPNLLNGVSAGGQFPDIAEITGSVSPSGLMVQTKYTLSSDGIVQISGNLSMTNGDDAKSLILRINDEYQVSLLTQTNNDLDEGGIGHVGFSVHQFIPVKKGDMIYLIKQINGNDYKGSTEYCISTFNFYPIG